MDELMANLREAVAGWLAADIASPAPGSGKRVLELVL